jgi:hypothetical protein
MDIDKPMVIGERREVRPALIRSIVLMPLMVWVISLNSADWWAWLFGALFLWALFGNLKEYLRFRKGQVVGTTITIDAEGVTVERIGKSLRVFRWRHMDSMTVCCEKESIYEFRLTFLIKHDKQEKTFKTTYTYNDGSVVPIPNLNTLRRKVEYFSNGKIKVHFNKNAVKLAQWYRLVHW